MDDGDSTTECIVSIAAQINGYHLDNDTTNYSERCSLTLCDKKDGGEQVKRAPGMVEWNFCNE